MSTTVRECGPPNFSRLNFFLSTRIWEQSSVSAEVSVERRSGIVTESVVVHMIAPERRERRSGVACGQETPKVAKPTLMSDKN